MLRFRLLVLALAAASFGVAGEARAQARLSGGIGVELDTQDFENDLRPSGRSFSVRRGTSRQYLDLRFSTPVFSPELFQFESSAKVQGTYHRVATGTERNKVYFGPDLPAYTGSLSVFPARRYPLRLYSVGTRDTPVRYEAQFRSKGDLAAPELGVIRRYESDLATNGLNWKLGIAQDVQFGLEVRQERAESRRRYDFGEDRDIWIDFLTTRPDPTASRHPVELVNQLPGDSVIVFVDLVRVADVPPGGTTSILVDDGGHEVDIVPRRFNPFRTTVDVQGDMRWRVIHTPPSGSKDTDQKSNNVQASLDAGSGERFKSETRLDFSNSSESVQKNTTELSNFNNRATWVLSKTAGIDFLTNYAVNSTTIDTLSSQRTSSFVQQQTLRAGDPGGRQARLAYQFNRTSSVIGADEVKTTNHVPEATLTTPIRTGRSVLDLRTGATLFRDARGNARNQYSASAVATSRIRRWGVIWQPRETFSYAINRQRNPDNSSREREAGLSLVGEVPSAGPLGSLTLKGEGVWRRRGDGKQVESRGRNLFEVLLSRSLGEDHRIQMGALREIEAVAFKADDGPAASSPGTRQVRYGYRIHVQTAPFKGFLLTGSAAATMQERTNLSRLGASASGNIPATRVSVRWYVQSETRSLEGLSNQTSLTIETRLGYVFRQVSFAVEHRLMRETLVTEQYRLSELRAQVARQFFIR